MAKKESVAENELRILTLSVDESNLNNRTVYVWPKTCAWLSQSKQKKTVNFDLFLFINDMHCAISICST